MLRGLLFSVAAILFAVSVFAQTGTIKGTVKDASTGEAVIGANVFIAGTTQGSAADINGEFEIPKVKAGTYSIVVSFVSYKTDTVKNITVYPDQITVMNTSMYEESVQLSDVIVSAQRLNNTDVSVISAIKNAELVVVGISAQQISLSQDRDAAQVIKRIPGITVTNNRFVNVRGLSERYSTVLLNGVIAPSTEVDSRAFAFDLIPSSMIDNMLVYKSGSADLPGEFAGAIVDIATKSVVESNSLSFNLTSGFRANSTFKDFYKGNGSSTDWLGYDNGKRGLPSDFPSENLRQFSQNPSEQNTSKLINASKSLTNSWGINKGTANPDYRATLNFSHVFNIGAKRLTNITSLSYTRTFQTINQENYYYDAFDESTQKSNGRYKYYDQRYSDNARIGLISNFVFEFNPSHKIEFRNLYNQLGSSQVTTRTGTELIQGFDVNNRALNYYSRGIYSGQLQGKHNFGDHWYATWTGAYSSVTADQPDYRRIRSQRTQGTDDTFAIVIPPNANAFDAGRFYSDLKETTYTGVARVDYKINPDADENKQAKISVGGYYAQTDRTFDARWFSYKWSTLGNRPPSILEQSFNTIFSQDNIGFSALNGEAPYFILEEGTNFSDKYTGKNLYTAGYLNGSLALSAKLRMTTGVRVEYNRQQVDSYDSDGSPVNVDNPVTSVLPFLNLTFNATEKTKIRFAYGKTVNRPVFRELAPFNFYDFDRNANQYGNPNLVTAQVHNIDLRYDFYPSSPELISFGVFYKYFKNPIESELIGGSNIIYTWRNATSATSYGAEIEVRKSLDNLTGSGFIDKFTVLLNAAVIKSNVDLGEVTNQEKERAMQGQSPYIANAQLFYNDYEHGLQVNLSYNIFGKRIFAVGDLDQNATQYEMPRNQLDLTFSKELGRRLELKFGIQDILNAPYRLIQDSNRDRKINDADEKISYYKTGQYVNLGLNFKIY